MKHLALLASRFVIVAGSGVGLALASAVLPQGRMTTALAVNVDANSYR